MPWLAFSEFDVSPSRDSVRASFGTLLLWVVFSLFARPFVMIEVVPYRCFLSVFLFPFSRIRETVVPCLSRLPDEVANHVARLTWAKC